jgi:hypothetical protein
MLLDMDWGGIFDEARVTGEDGPAWDCIGQSESQYPSELVNANLIQASISDKFTLAASANIPQFGLSAEADLTSAMNASIKVSGVQARVFVKPISGFLLMQELLKLKVANPALWNWVNDDILVTETYYVTSFLISFKNSGSLTAKAAFEAGKIRLDPKLTATWLSDSTLESKGVPTVAVAYRGLRV